VAATVTVLAPRPDSGSAAAAAATSAADTAAQARILPNGIWLEFSSQSDVHRTAAIALDDCPCRMAVPRAVSNVTVVVTLQLSARPGQVCAWNGDSVTVTLSNAQFLHSSAFSLEPGVRYR
jgi:hypothetical protein